MKIHVEVTDTNGRTWVSDTSEDLPRGQVNQLRDIFADFADLSKLSIEIDENKHYFNTAHVVKVAIIEVTR